MAMSEMESGDILAAFGDSREEALEKLEDLFPEDDRPLSIQVGDGEDVLEKMKELARDIDEQAESSESA